MTERRRSTPFIAAVIVLVATLLVTATSTAHAWTRSPERIAGINRYQTAVDLSNAAFPDGAEHAVIVSGESFPDGLAAGPLAAALDGPVLLTLKDGLPETVIGELQRLKVTEVTVVGGTAAVGDLVLFQLWQTVGTEPHRIAGVDRYDTAARVAATFPAGAPVAYMAGGSTFPDALTAGAAAATAGAPLVLVPADVVPPTVTNVIATLAPAELRVVGGPAAVADPVLEQLRTRVANVRRIAGADRYATAAAVASDNSNQPTEVIVATGLTFADALAAAPLAALRVAPIVLTTAPCAPNATVDVMRTMRWPDVTIVGGSAAVSSGSGAVTVPCSPIRDGTLAPGVAMRTEVLPGPIVVHIVTIDRSKGYDVRTVTATGKLQGRLEVTGIARRTNALLAVNGGFFQDNGEPSHGFAMNGHLLKWPGLENTVVGFNPAAPTYGLFAAPDASVVLNIGESIEPVPVIVNEDGPPPADSFELLTPDSKRQFESGTWCHATVNATGSPSLDSTGATVQPYSVTSAACNDDPVPRTGHVFVAVPGTAAGDTLEQLKANQTVTMSWHLHPSDKGVFDVVGANVTLVFGMQVASDVTGGTGPFFTEKAPRTAIAQKPDGTLLLVTVDGRQPGWSIGMTPRQLADYLVDLGAIDAANLDGGGSTALAVNQLLVNRPSDSSGERPVGSALVIVPHGTNPQIAPPVETASGGADPDFDSASIGGWEESRPG
jgi:putative cell wall-binding protein